MKTWFTCLAKNGEGEIAIFDEIGAFGISAKDFSDQLTALGKVDTITLSINSPGGSVFDGFAIYNMLQRHRALITVRVDGIAASMASVIAMAGDVVEMPENAMMMIHDPMGGVLGNSRDMRQIADALDKMKAGMVAAYANKSGLDRQEIEDLMAAETWFTAEEAKDMGFADVIEEPVKMAASFDLSKFKNAPVEAGRKRGPAASTALQKETAMSESNEPAIEPETAGTPEAPAPIVEAAPAEPTPEVVEPVAENAEQITARARKESADIAAVCKIAGKAERTADFLAEGKSLAEVSAVLLAEKATAPTAEISARHGNPAPDQPFSWDETAASVNKSFGLKG